MLSVKGVFEHGYAKPLEYVKGYEGKEVIITFLDKEIAGDLPDTQSDLTLDELQTALSEAGYNTKFIESVVKGFEKSDFYAERQI